MPTPPNNALNVVLAIKRGSAPKQDRKSCIWRRVEWYDVALKPNTPISVGQRVRIISIRETKNTHNDENRNSTTYTAFDTGVEGQVVRIRAMERDTVEFVIKNETEWMTTETVYLTAELKQGVTVQLSLLQRVIHATTAWWAPSTRWIWTEEKASVRSDETSPNL